MVTLASIHCGFAIGFKIRVRNLFCIQNFGCEEDLLYYGTLGAVPSDTDFVETPILVYPCFTAVQHCGYNCKVFPSLETESPEPPCAYLSGTPHIWVWLKGHNMHHSGRTGQFFSK